MKRKSKDLLTLLLVLSMVFVLAACSSSDDSSGENDSETAIYTDGTYTGEGEHREHGYEEAEVTVENGEITNIVLKRMTTDGEEVNYDEWVGEDDRPNLKQFKDDLAQDMIEKQSYEVDAIATATQTSKGWMEAVKNALDQAK